MSYLCCLIYLKNILNNMFSIIVPLYNKAPYIEKTINSIFSQVFKAFELIVVDDGSTDDSFTQLQVISYKLQEEDPSQFRKLKIIQQSNQGVSVARNNGVKAAKYDYIAFLDADDWWAPSYLEEIARLIREYPKAGIYACSYFKVKQGKFISAQIGVSSDFEKGSIDYFEAYSKSLWMPVWTGAAVVPRNAFNKIGGFKINLSLGEDFDLWLRIALSYQVVLLNRPLAFYNQDVDLSKRAIGRLHNPKSHILFNLDCFEKEALNNNKLKQLLDNLRTYGLFPYYLSREYRPNAKYELKKVNWKKQPRSMIRKYKMPITLLKLQNFIFVFLYNFKMIISK